MINHNELLYDLLNGTLKVDYNGLEWSSNFIEGDIFEVWAELSTKKTKYPLIWLQSGYEVQANKSQSNDNITLNNLSFYLITKGDSHDFNKKRYADTYKYILYPLLEQFKKAIASKKGITLDNEYSFITFPFNNISELSEKKSSLSRPQTTTLVDIWDALALNVNININSGCFPQYKI